MMVGEGVVVFSLVCSSLKLIKIEKRRIFGVFFWNVFIKNKRIVRGYVSGLFISPTVYTGGDAFFIYIFFYQGGICI